MPAVAFCLGLLLVSGCLQSPTVTCADGRVCPEARVCAPAGGCVDPAQIDACGGKNEGEGCTLAGIGDGLCRDSVCVVAGCGDGILDVGEACDDGNEIDDDACTNNCTVSTCGDSIVHAGEQCDDGAANGDDRACTSRCMTAVCGDNFILAGVEECDAATANADNDACTTQCLRNVCGDGKQWLGVEACDDGDTTPGTGPCASDCGKLRTCGDGQIDFGEACDDGNVNPADGCNSCATTLWIATPVVGGSDRLGPKAQLSGPSAVAVDGFGNLFIADTNNHVIRRVDKETEVITTVAGDGSSGFAGDGRAATSAQLSSPSGVAVDGLGNVFVADRGNHRIRRVDGLTGIISTVAGTGFSGFAGDGGAATSAQFDFPEDVAVDGLGTLFVADSSNHRIRRIDGVTGFITTVAGSGASGVFSGGFEGDGNAATGARLDGPSGVAVDAVGNLFIADTDNHRIRHVDAATGDISTMAGSGPVNPDIGDFSGDGAAATGARLKWPRGVSVDALGNMFFSDTGNHRIRRVDSSTQLIATVAGSGVAGTGGGGFSGDGGPAVAAELYFPVGVEVDGLGNLAFADSINHRVRSVDSSTGVIVTVAGDGSQEPSGDGGAGTSTQLDGPFGISIDGLGNLFVADRAHHRIRRLDGVSGVMSTVAGDGSAGFSGDGGDAARAQLNRPGGVVVDSSGNLFISDDDNHRIRRVDGSTNVITTIAGTGLAGFGGDGGAATEAQLDGPSGLAVDTQGNLFIADWGNHRIRRIDALAGTITTVAGSGGFGPGNGAYLGDDGAATSAQLDSPNDVAVDGVGNLFIADYRNHCIRRVDGGTGVITTVVGDGAPGFVGDGDFATNASIARPTGVVVDGTGNLFISDSDNHRVRRVDASSGVITTVAGSGATGVFQGAFNGDGGSATSAQLDEPQGLAVDGAGTLLIADAATDRVRQVTGTGGTITTVVGGVDRIGAGPLAQARLSDSRAIVVTPSLALFAGGTSGTVQAARTSVGSLEVVAGRYAHSPATGALARFRDDSFGTVGGIAYDPTAKRIYLTESSTNRVYVVTALDVADENSWTISVLANAAGAAGFVDGAVAAAAFRDPTGLYLDASSGTLYVADTGNHVIRAIDLSGNTVSTVAGIPEILGFFGDSGLATAALLHRPQALTRCANGDLFVADTGNHRVRRIAAGTGVITTVLGDGNAASSGQGPLARNFPVNAPLGLACDSFGNLFVTSTTTVRMLAASDANVVDGTNAVQTIYGEPPRASFPASVSFCLTGIAVVDDQTLWVADSCTGILAELSRQPTP